MSSENSVTISEAPTEAMAPTVEAPTRPENVPEKFWDVESGQVNQEALLKSYAELETQRTKPPEQNAGIEPEAQTALQKAGIDQDQLSKEWQESGKLTDESYSKLEKAGYSKSMVDQYLAGSKAGEQEAVLVQADIEQIKGSVESFDAMSTWAKANADPADLKSFNEMVSAGNKQQAMAAVSWMNSKYVAAEGSEPTLMGGGETGTDFSAFRSVAEVTTAMKDSRYGKDDAYTKDVMQKVGRSKVF